MLSAEPDRELNGVTRMLGQERSALIQKALLYCLDYLDPDLARERARKYESGEAPGLTAPELRTELDV